MGQPAQVQASGRAPGVSIVQHEGYPELRVDGIPFFIHSGAFFYDRVPRDLWERVLDRYRSLGINTIEIYIPWNWHEPREGEFDFDGHTNPRRDLRSLLRLIDEKGFKLIARPGPQILNEWRHGGYPGWLLERPEYHMDLVDRLEGRYPPFSYLNTQDAEAAAKELLENPTHMSYTRKWLEAVACELAPYSLSGTTHSEAQSTASSEASGPLLFVQLEDDLAIGRTNSIGPLFWRYLDMLHQILEASGLTSAVFINPTDMRVSAAGSAVARPIGVMGQWYMSPRDENEGRPPQLTAQDVSDIEFYVEELKTQPVFPPVFIEYQAGWYCLGNDDRPLASPPENTVLSSRLAIGHGLHGLNYFPLQDTFTPAGYSVPWVNRSYRWDAAIDPNGNFGPRARAVARNGKMLLQWGEWLAASHQRVDFGIVYPVGAYPQELLSARDVLQVSSIVLRLERVGQLARLSSELVAPQYQPVEQLLKYAVLLLPVPDASDPKFELSETAQRALVEYVRHGGTLIYFPSQPAGRIFQELWATPITDPLNLFAISRRWRFGTGQVIESMKDFYSWPTLDKGFAENRAQQEAVWATQILEEFLNAADVRPVVKRSTGANSPDLVITELVSNEGTHLAGARSGGTGLLSVTNTSDAPVDETIEVLTPGTSARTLGNPYLPVHVVVPAKESLLLPLMQPLCSANVPPQDCRDWVVSAGAELLHVSRNHDTLQLTFYTPTRASARFKLINRPSHASLEETKSEAKWNSDLHELEVELPRAASPNFTRTINIALSYTPQVAEETEAHNEPRARFEYTVADAVRLPAGEGASLWPDPPLLSLDARHSAKLIFQVINPDPKQYHDFNFRLEGQLHGNDRVRIPAGGTAFATVKLKTAAGRETDLGEIQPGEDGLVHGMLEIHSGNERVHSPILFAFVHPGAVSHYQFDFDRDGAMEWVLENSTLRLIVSPESGGRALAFVNKDPNSNLITSVGALRDNFSFALNSPGAPAERARGRYGLFNRPYHAEWIQEQGTPALRMRFDAPDILPAGAGIEKTIRLENTNTLQADYHVQLFPIERAAAQANPPQAFVAVNSVPAIFRADRSTRFCWTNSHSEAHCEIFSPERAAVELPEGIHRLEVRTPGRPGLALEWSCTKPPAHPCGQMRIDMKRFSALLQLQFPPLVPGGAPGEYLIRFEVLAVQSAGAPRRPWSAIIGKASNHSMSCSKIYAAFVLAFLLARLAVSSPAQAQDAQGPIAPPPKFEVKRIPSSPKPGAPPLPAEQIIRRFAANEELFKKAYNSCRLEQTVRVQELDDNGKPSGQFTMTDEVYTKADGQRYLRVAKPPESTLRRTAFSLEDVRTLSRLPLFFLTADELSHYDLSYEGQEKLDEINTFIFRVKPKQPELGRWLFDGVVWVDDHDIAIVKTYGKFVTEVTAKTPESLFTTFETYRENFAGKYWFPTYTRSDEMVALKGGDLHLQLIIRSSKVEPQNSTSAADTPAPPTAESSTPAAKPPE